MLEEPDCSECPEPQQGARSCRPAPRLEVGADRSREPRVPHGKARPLAQLFRPQLDDERPGDEHGEQHDGAARTARETRRGAPHGANGSGTGADCPARGIHGAGGVAPPGQLRRGARAARQGHRDSFARGGGEGSAIQVVHLQSRRGLRSGFGSRRRRRRRNDRGQGRGRARRGGGPSAGRWRRWCARRDGQLRRSSSTRGGPPPGAPARAPHQQQRRLGGARRRRRRRRERPAVASGSPPRGLARWRAAVTRPPQRW
mmetsp:Transcript_7462/g.18797  ORF Transcript_7462/g.18797 Transcript_7462/m.18797 type:complete len:258 (+) Transcript_7462:1094-1867(+)